MSVEEMEVQKVPLHFPSLEEVAQVLEKGLLENFEIAQVRVVDCPDLTQKPFGLADKGLCGSTRVADVGGVPNLVPLVNRNKKYDLESVAEQCELPGALVVGAGAGPWHVEGVNSEMMANIKTSNASCCLNNTRLCKIDTKNGGYFLKKAPTTNFTLLGNFFISEGKPGKVLEVNASKRKGPHNLMECLRTSLADHYGDKAVGLGGTFLVESGKVKIHVMPDFSKVALNSDEEVDNWLHFYEMSSPFVCVGYLMSHDPDLDLRIEHFHGYSDHGDGGHYHYDTTPQEVSYRGYFNLGEYIFRIDRPKETHMIGRDCMPINLE